MAQPGSGLIEITRLDGFPVLRLELPPRFVASVLPSAVVAFVAITARGAVVELMGAGGNCCTPPARRRRP
jgi:hypothetical protein